MYDTSQVIKSVVFIIQFQQIIYCGFYETVFTSLGVIRKGKAKNKILVPNYWVGKRLKKSFINTKSVNSKNWFWYNIIFISLWI